MKRIINKPVAFFISILFLLILCSCSGAGQSFEPTQKTTETTSTNYSDLSNATTQYPFTAEPTIEQITEEPESVLHNPEWKDEYIGYINGLSDSAGSEKFALIDIDENGIPELFFDSGFDLGGGSLSSFSQGEINTISTGSGGVYYCAGSVCCNSGRQGVYAKKVYNISDGIIQCVFDGNERAISWNFDMDNPDDFSYSYRTDEYSDYQSVPYDEYTSAFFNVFNSGEGIDIDWMYDSSNIISAIRDY